MEWLMALSHFYMFLVLTLFVHLSRCTAYVVDFGSGVGRRFDGIGGLSGGGATSKLLVNYEAPLRNEILDYLFKPDFGASLQILKVEIGGDGQSTEGTESSHMHESWDESYDRGYEWGLMVEAKKRNPAIKLYGLPWSFPGWVAMGTQNPFTNVTVTANYIVNWVAGAKKYYNLDIDYVGIWNERLFNVDYIKALRQTLDARGFGKVEIVAADNEWFISAAILKDPDVAKAVSIIGAHYPGTISSKVAVNTSKPLWSSEDYSTYNDDVGAGCWARILNQNYVNGLMTSTISWNLIASYYEDLPYGRDGLMTAMEPWSGHYVVETPMWVTAHTTWFTSIGWSYLQHGYGVGHLDNGGSYVTLTDPNRQHISIIIETMSHDHSLCIRPGLPPYTVTPQNVTFTLQGQLAKLNQLFVWRSRLYFNGKPSIMFQKRTPLQVLNGIVSLTLDVDEIYTLTTLDKPAPKPYSDPPASSPFPLPYADNYNAYPVNSEAFNFVPQIGVWEIRETKVKGHEKVNRQVMLHDACYWCNPGPVPISVGGNYNWSNIFIQMDVFIPSVNGTSGVFLGARVTHGGCDMASGSGIYLAVYANTDNYTVAEDYAMKKVLFSGKLPTVMKYDQWYHIGLVVTDNNAFGFFDESQLFEKKIIPSKPANGFAAYGAATYGIADYDNLMIQQSYGPHIITF